MSLFVIAAFQMMFCYQNCDSVGFSVLSGEQVQVQQVLFILRELHGIFN